MPNAVPYLILVFLSVVTMTYVFLRTRAYITLVWFLALSGLIFVFEFIVLVLFNSYTYYPELIDNPYLDSLFGALVSNFCAVPVVGITIVTFRLRFIWFIVFALFFTGVEWLFIRLGIYEHHWWRLSYTFVFMTLFFWLSRFWANQTVRGSKLFRYLSMLLFCVCLCNTVSFLMLLAGSNDFYIGWFANPTRDNVVVSFLFILGTGIILTSTIYWTTALRWIIAALAIVTAIQIVLYATGIIRIYISLWLFYPMFLVCHGLIAWLLVKSRYALNGLKQ
ncbi:hypothetical protein H8B09_27535 [Paenibacillus sp. PR3]|uniref:Uncharacterized protein n=1 Tax=Paenibacillus terricola TaxID=2763503 RepID=A0ABR8N5L2_9BACL|nr:hypothetical protein [Paenibacillus terricola]MBD3922536.1 hypothetical protein [Paenibacillus terricola]